MSLIEQQCNCMMKPKRAHELVEMVFNEVDQKTIPEAKHILAQMVQREDITKEESMFIRFVFHGIIEEMITVWKEEK